MNLSISRRTLIAICAIPVASFGVAAQNSDQPIRIVVPYAPGGSSDLIARTLAERITSANGLPVVVDNKPGGGTVIGAQSVHTAPANGQHVLLVAASFVINPYLMKQLPYDSAKDFVPVTLVGSNPHVLVVSPRVPANNLQEFISWARTRKGQGSYASFGNGSSGHLGFELFKMSGKFEMLHVPYKGAAPAMADLIGGQVDAMLADLPQAITQIKAGKVKAIGVASEVRAESLANVPTFSETGLPGFESKSWYGLLVRSGTSQAQVTALNTAFVGALRDPLVKQKFAQNGLDVSGTGAAEFGAFLSRESTRYGEAVRFSGAKVD